VTGVGSGRIEGQKEEQSRILSYIHQVLRFCLSLYERVCGVAADNKNQRQRSKSNGGLRPVNRTDTRASNKQNHDRPTYRSAHGRISPKTNSRIDNKTVTCINQASKRFDEIAPFCEGNSRDSKAQIFQKEKNYQITRPYLLRKNKQSRAVE
jgi:hypothetical protein